MSLMISGLALLGTMVLAFKTYAINDDVNNRIDDNSNRIGELEPDVTSICSVVCYILVCDQRFSF